MRFVQGYRTHAVEVFAEVPGSIPQSQGSILEPFPRDPRAHPDATTKAGCPANRNAGFIRQPQCGPLACRMSPALSPLRRLRDKTDVVELILRRKLPRDLAVAPSVRLLYLETCDALQAES